MLIVIIAVSLFCGSIYLILGTNLGARLGFLVALTGLAGWMSLMGIIWMIYGIGLKGPEPSWAEVPGRTVLQDTDALYQAGVFEQRVEVPEDATLPEEAEIVADRVRRRGVGRADRGRPGVRPGGGRGRRVPRGDRRVRGGRVPGREVFDIGGERYPMIGDFDLLAFSTNRTTWSSRSPRSCRRAPSRAGARHRRYRRTRSASTST